MTEVKLIREIWVALQVEANGQEQIVRFLNSPLIVCDPEKVQMMRQIVDMQIWNDGGDITIAKFTERTNIERTEGVGLKGLEALK